MIVILLYTGGMTLSRDIIVLGIIGCHLLIGVIYLHTQVSASIVSDDLQSNCHD